MNMRRYIPFVLIAQLLLASCGVEGVIRKAEQSYALGEYHAAAALYKKAYSKTDSKDNPKRAEQAFKTAECWSYI
jgi:hypothetical protein